MADLLKGAPVARAVMDSLAPRVEALLARGVVPKLALVRVGDRADDLAYERAAVRRCESAGIAVVRHELSHDCSQDQLMAVIDQVNADDSVHGCLMFRPLPAHLDEAAATRALDPAKDVDGITPGSLFGVFAGQPEGFPPCTAAACLAILEGYDVPLEGADVAVVGRSLVVGRPVSLMLQQGNATVTMCHTRTRDLARTLRRADVVVACAGSMGCIGYECVREGQVVVDVGINWDERAQRLRGDVDFDAVEPVVRAITPVPGGVGAVTTAVLARHVVEAAERKAR